MILASNTLRTTGKLYDVYIDESAPISPGSGWILMNSGFSLFNVYFLFGATYIAILLATIRFFRYSNSFLNLFCLFLGISLVFCELLLNGHDFLPVSMAFFKLFLIVFKNLMTTTKIWKILLIGILLGLVSTSRIVFITIPVLFAFILMRFHRKNAALLLSFASITNISLNLYYYSINDFFQPIHILGKAQRLLGMNLLFFVTILGLGVLFFLSKTIQSDLAKIAKRVALVLAVFLMPVAYFELFRLHFDFAVWEGANYLMPISPFFVYYLCASYSELKK